MGKLAIEEIEREFRYFKISSAQDKKYVIIIYGGREIARLAKHLPDPVDPHGKLDEYKTLLTKLNEYFIPKKNTHYTRYLFLKLRPEKGESTVAYAREKSSDSNFGNNCDERILEHLIQTSDKSWTLQEFLKEAGQIEDISRQMHEMRPIQSYKEIIK